jgi:3-hydroxyisobutyrate dehydrogenase
MSSIESRPYESAQARKVAFIGLGTMGFPMAGHLARAGHEVTVFNRSPEKAQRWCAEFGGRHAPDARAAAEGAEFVFSCVGNDADLRAVTLGDAGAFASMPAGAVFVDHTTASADGARQLASAARDRGLSFLDAPVSGGPIGAQRGGLTVMCGGDAATFERVRPVILTYARACALMGPTGAGQLAKMVNQICLAGLVQALCEGIAFGEKAGLDMVQVLDVIGKGAAQSWQMDNRGKAMIAGDFGGGFAVDLLRKDLGLAIDESRRLGARVPVTALVDQFYADLQAAGGGRWDSASLLKRLR